MFPFGRDKDFPPMSRVPTIEFLAWSNMIGCKSSTSVAVVASLSLKLTPRKTHMASSLLEPFSYDTPEVIFATSGVYHMPVLLTISDTRQFAKSRTS